MYYAFPKHPGDLNLTGITTQYVRSEKCEDHREKLRLFCEATNVRAAMLKQIAQAILEIYIKRFRNKHTHALDEDIYVILSYLIKTYGKVTNEELQEQEDNLWGRVFETTQPIILLFNEIEDLLEVATQNTNKYTDTQLVNLGVRLVKNMNDFEKGLTDWFAKSAIDRTWKNFKPHFETAYTKLEQVRGLSMKNSVFNQQANSITPILQEL